MKRTTVGNSFPIVSFRTIMADHALVRLVLVGDCAPRPRILLRLRVKLITLLFFLALSSFDWIFTERRCATIAVDAEESLAFFVFV